ncbi:MAG: hypothetical protein ACRDZN_10555, partial [Acidimicrobiales bacterium]
MPTPHGAEDPCVRRRYRRRLPRARPSSRRDYRLGVDQGARNLVAACAGTSGHTLVDDPGAEPTGDGAVRFSVEPALGTHA